MLDRAKRQAEALRSTADLLEREYMAYFSTEDFLAVADLIESLIAHLESAQPKWISVEERLPEPNRKVLTIRKECSGTGRYRYAMDNTILWIDGTLVWGVDMETWKGRVTHWMPLPEPPKEET